MKLKKLHLFLLIIVALLASTLGFTVHEYFQNQDSSDALKKGSNYDPFSNAASDLKKDYSETIAGLEDIVVPGRGNGKHKKHHKKHTKNNDDDDDSDLPNPDNINNYNDEGVDMSKYILKSEVVPPVCPKCPDSRSCPRQKPCPACPPCARCPEPAFTCKKVPNYNAISASRASGILPLPQLNSFAAFN
jgi:hypothetical protein